MDNTPAPAEQGPTKKTPSEFDAVDVNWLTHVIAWPFPTWIEKDLYNDEFLCELDEEIAARLIRMFTTLGKKIDKAFAGDTVADSLKFDYFRKISETATKLKPLKLKATMYQNTNYGNPWVLVEYA